ncbi:MAG TPA: serine hydrolase [Rhodanobacteraceae bacterium]|nr:serine hydrolase [Rhodanobacteraceae bacterium]
MLTFERRLRQSGLATALALSILALPVLAADAPAQTAAIAAPQATLLPPQLADFTAYVDQVREEFRVPGIAVAIVKDGKVVLEQGYGLREIGKPAKVDANTLFAIASNTKAFTAAALSMLADQGKLDMDDRVIDHLPWFRMSDPYITHAMRIRDLLAHRSGLSLGAGDLLYWPTTDYSTREVVERLARVPITGEFRAQYAYDNILFAVAELVIEQVSGQDYADFLQQHFFTPLGMDGTRINYLALKPTDTDVATGHALYDFKDLKPAMKLAWANNSGAGGIYSSVHDMAKWITAQLAGGVYGKDKEGKPLRLFSEKRQQEMWSVLTPIPVRKPSVPALAAATPNFQGYGEGWHLSDYRGQKLVWHTGGWPGMVSRVTLVPGQNLGMVVLTNQEIGAAFNAVTLRILDAYLDAPKTDWVAAFAAAQAKSIGKADESWQKHLDARAKHAPPSLALAAYAGSYRDPWYGDVNITLERGKLVMRFAHTSQLIGDMSPWQHDSFIVRWHDRSLNADAFATFLLDADAKITGLRIKAISPRTDFSFDFQDLRLTPVAAEAKSGH